MTPEVLAAIDAVLVRRKGSAATLASARYAANQWLTARNFPSTHADDFRIAILAIGVDIVAGPYGEALPGITLEQSAYRRLRAEQEPQA
ncbi:hypothetical protein [Streptomyces sp. LN500]|uniref:hypothetical protein n=1 Tax=Streptomyces sp. LN500 TaxID=3112978 RepID=UPI00371D2B98